MCAEFLEDDGKRKYTTFHVKPYKTKELAAIYMVSEKIFRNWLKRIRTKLGERYGQHLTVNQVEIIISHYTLPYFIQVEVLSEDEAEKKKRNI